MRGNNKFQLNQATIILAIQFYFDQVIFKEGIAPKVTNIEMKGTSYDQTFEVSLSDQVELLKKTGE